MVMIRLEENVFFIDQALDRVKNMGVQEWFRVSVKHLQRPLTAAANKDKLF